MRISATDLPDVFIIEMKTFSDNRGLIKELWNAPRYLNHGLGVPSVQTNFSRSSRASCAACITRSRTARASWSW